MAELPPDLLAALPAGVGPVAAAWWASLADADRRRVADLWDDRLDVRFFTPQDDDTWEQVPAVAGGRFAPTGDDGRAEWSPGYFEYLLQNPELVMAYDPTHGFLVGGVCTRHPAARACVAAGGVPADFACPVGDAGCPLVPLRGATLTRRSAT